MFSVEADWDQLVKANRTRIRLFGGEDKRERLCWVDGHYGET